MNATQSPSAMRFTRGTRQGIYVDATYALVSPAPSSWAGR